MARKCLLIGCSQYDDNALEYLSSVPTDLKTLTKIFSNPSYGHFDSVDILENYILRELSIEITDFVTGLKSNDEALIFFLGHGRYIGEELYICCKNSLPKYLDDTALKFKNLVEKINGVLTTANLVVILDLCYSGLGVNGAESFFIGKNDALGDKNIAVISSSQYFQTAKEYRDGSGGIFVKALYEGIINKKANIFEDNLLTVRSFIEYCSSIFNNKSPQIPSFFHLLKKKFVLSSIPSLGENFFDVDFEKFKNATHSKMRFNKSFDVLFQRDLNLTFREAVRNLDRNFTEGKQEFSIFELHEIINKENFTCIVGEGGSGKSFSLRSVFSSYNEKSGDYILPIYFDLKNNNQEGLLIYLWKIFTEVIGLPVSDIKLNELLTQHNYILVIDTFDELDNRKKKNFIEELEQIQTKFNFKIVIASRSTDKLHDLPEKIRFFQIQRLGFSEVEKTLDSQLITSLGRAGILDYASTPLSLAVLKLQEKKYLREGTPKSKEMLLVDYLDVLLSEIVSESGYAKDYIEDTLSRIAASRYISIELNDYKKDTPLLNALKKHSLLNENNDLVFPHAELQAACASIVLSKKELDSFVKELGEYDLNELISKDVTVYISLRSVQLAEYFSTEILDKFLLKNEAEYLIAAAKIAKVGKCEEKVSRKIINQIINVYDLQAEKFYHLWKYLHPIIFTWDDKVITDTLIDYLKEDELRPIKLNVFHHSLSIMQNEFWVAWLYDKYNDFLDDRHMLYSILEVMWLRKEVRKENLLKDRFMNSPYPIEKSAILKCIYASGNEEVMVSITGAKFDTPLEKVVRGKVVEEILNYYYSERNDVDDIEKGHVIIELSVHNQQKCNELLNVIGIKNPSNKLSNTLRYHSYYAMQNLSKLSDYWRL